MSLKISKKDRKLAEEERRFVVLLGILTLIIGYRNSLPSDFPYPLPYPVPHLQIFVLPVFDRFVYVFAFYAGFMLVYFSESLFASWVREIFRRGAWSFIIGYWANFLYISSALLVSIYVPEFLIQPYLWLFGVGLLVVWVGILEYLIGRHMVIRQTVHGLITRLLQVTRSWIMEMTLEVLGSRFGRKLRKRLPAQLKKAVRGLQLVRRS